MNQGKINLEYLLETSGAFWKACVLHAAVKLDIFTKIGSKNLEGRDVARKVGANARAMEMLLSALVAMRLLAKKKQRYFNQPVSLLFLSKDSDKYIGHIIMHHHHMINLWSKLDQAVITGKPQKDFTKKRATDELESFLMGMFNMAMVLAPELVKKIDLSGRSRLLDLGGGPGTYAIHFCLNNPRLTATVCDLPTTRPFAEKVIKKFGLQNRVDFKNVDYLNDAIPGNYDVAWLSHILHQEGEEGAKKIIKKAVSALRPGGLIILHDFILDDSLDRPFFPAIFSLNMLLATKGGQSYSDGQLRKMLKSAGVKNIKRIPFSSFNDSGIILGIV